MPLHLLSHAEQVAAHLRSELLSGRWSAGMPGILALETEFGVNRNTMAAALQILETEGILVPQGPGKRRRVVLPEEGVAPRPLKIRLLSYESDCRTAYYNIELLDQLTEAGFAAGFAGKHLHELGMDVKRVARFVRKTSADAWIVSASSREILEWFSEQDLPAIAMFGRFSGLPIAAASPRKAPAIIAAIRKLVDLGHRRIAMLVREERRNPHPALFEQMFLNELEAQGLTTGPYNLPDWKDSPDGLRTCLDSLFQHTPPTALFISEAKLFAAAQQHLARKGIHAPEDVSLVCDDPDPTFAWCDPQISHITWNHRPVVRRVLRWANHIARGKEDKRQSLTDGEFVEGGTIGPVPI